MIFVLFRKLTVLALMLLAMPSVQAAVTCTSAVSSPTPIGTNYLSNTTVSLQMSVKITCNRDLASEAMNGLPYSLAADNGAYANGQNNNARLAFNGTNYDLRYDVFQGSCNGQQWRSNNPITGTVTWPAGVTGPASDTKPFWFCIKTATTPTAAGVYRDSIALTATYNNITATVGTIPVAIYAPANCTINSGPGDFGLTYNAFQASALISARPFISTCTVDMPYGISVSPSAGTLAGVNYSVDITDAGVSGNVVTTTNGTVGARTLYVRVTAPAAQAGTCTGATCTASQSHTLTLTY